MSIEIGSLPEKEITQSIYDRPALIEFYLLSPVGMAAYHGITAQVNQILGQLTVKRRRKLLEFIIPMEKTNHLFLIGTILLERRQDMLANIRIYAILSGCRRHAINTIPAER